MYVQEHGSVIKHLSSTTNSLHTLHLGTGYRGDLCLDGKRYFVVAGLRVQHEDNVMLVPFFILVENKTGLIVSQEVFQLIDYIATCIATSPAHQPQSNGVAERLVGLAKQCTRRLLLAAESQTSIGAMQCDLLQKCFDIKL